MFEKHQLRYRNKYSWTTSLPKITNDILYIYRKQLVFLILLDFTKPLTELNIHYTPFYWVVQQAVIIDYLTCKFISVINGLSQGSTLGPTLFINYTFRIYDIQLYLLGHESKFHELQRKVDSDLNSLFSTSNRYCLRVNPVK